MADVVGVKLFEKARSYLAKLKGIMLVDAQRGSNNTAGKCQQSVFKESIDWSGKKSCWKTYLR